MRGAAGIFEYSRWIRKGRKEKKRTEAKRREEKRKDRMKRRRKDMTCDFESLMGAVGAPFAVVVKVPYPEFPYPACGAWIVACLVRIHQCSFGTCH
jgi:hypothetical protein